MTTKSKWLKAKAMIPRNVDTALCTTGANMCCKLSMILRFLFPILVTKPCKEKKNNLILENLISTLWHTSTYMKKGIYRSGAIFSSSKKLGTKFYCCSIAVYTILGKSPSSSKDISCKMQISKKKSGRPKTWFLSQNF